MTLIEILEYADHYGIELKIYNDKSFLHPEDNFYFLELSKENRRFTAIINSYKGRDKALFNHPEYGDEKFKQWLYDVIVAFLHHEYFTSDDLKRTSEYATPINQDLGILGE